MSDLVIFDKCIARPDEQDRKYLLRDHLLGVKKAVEQRLESDYGFHCHDTIYIRLAGLAGVCHDMAKAHRKWQRYIRGKSKGGPNHAPEGAFLFSYLGYHLLQQERQWPSYAVHWLWLIRDIADHHGALKHLDDKHWMGAGAWEEMDLPGIAVFMEQVYPELRHVPMTVEALDQWIDQVYDVFKEAYDLLDVGYSPDYGKVMDQLSLWREITTALIAGDRFHVATIEKTGFNQEDHIRQDRKLDEYCRNNGDQAMAEIRNEAQSQILSQLAKDPGRRVYTLEMPTGYGKTITALKIAAWLGREQGYEKIIYVAPYLSILEQTSGVIEKAMDTSVLEHHSLAVVAEKQKDEDLEEEGKLHSGQLLMESWANPVVCTSFQQWSKAIFPGKAQDTLRRAYLHNSVVIIDEPQIFAPESWNVFLCGLESVTKLYNLRIFFLSATMPPFDYGLSEQPGCLAINPVKGMERYQVEQKGEMDEQVVAEYLLKRSRNGIDDKKALSRAAILNTIADAYLVYKQLSVKIKPPHLKLLHGMMIPLHKRVEIKKIKHSQAENKQECQYVISTQIIEAGVDLNFDHIIRALPILPSIIQAAGRVNRNGSGDRGILTLITFLRGGEKDTRGSIYPATLQKLTDELLQKQEVWLESELLELIKEYYRKMFARNSYEAGKQAIIDAYEGNWPLLGQQFTPFKEDYFKLPVFVPWQVEKEDRDFLPRRFVELQKRLGLYSAEDIYACYEDRDYYSHMSFETRKQFMILMNHYVVNVPAKLAFSLVGKDLYLINRIPCLWSGSDYDSVAGLAKRAVEGFDTII
ncbi:CRISPR-associated helicase/endonuclease Cas3 [Dehalobacterium formicoaceticum]|uniref:CRISPR-associated helicase/endonuclease Cas3 n=1 Tax=Dehalobacterium formicoaceticum TaxID=51515 RepID=A0ABT1Y8Q8_9FIRM|nr:CRISPR-associated helicase/endonuclease Cas3 [Dehalobacterium formicoaceticum]MCR6546871.1 CRISPR-associated helicase/endonuclease Cas3 [Dehalobacterium formicoaceticum]